MSEVRAVLLVNHQGEWKMAGKVFETGEGTIFLHEESGNQRHRNLDAPCGIDHVVLTWLLDHRISTIFHFDRARHILARAMVNTVLHKGTRQVSGGRDRYYLADPLWSFLRTRQLPWYVPWITDEIRLAEGDADEAVVNAPKDQAPRTIADYLDEETP